MKTFLTHILLVCGILMTISCGEDRTYEYEEKTQHNSWMHKMMLEHYLWADSLANYEPSWKSFFGKPSEFLSQLTKQSKQNDSWSFVQIDTLGDDPHQRGYFNHVESYGIDFKLMNDPTGQTTKQVLRVLTVYPNSPAERAGLVRNDFICLLNGNKFTSNNLSKLQKGVARELEVCHIAENLEDYSLYWTDTVVVSLAASEYVEDEAFPVSETIVMGDTLVGYLMCTRLTEGPVEEHVTPHVRYRQSLDAIMAQMKSAGVTEMVLDLRLCNLGNIDMAQRLASYVVSPDALGTTFAKTIWNQKHADQNKSYPYDTSVGNLGLQRIYIITSSYTQGAAEWLIHGLQHSMGEENVILVGTATKGQNVMTSEVWHDFYVRLNPVVAYVADGAGNYDYGSFTPTVELDEFTYVQLADYGDPEEILLNTALRHMLGLISQNDSEIEEESDKTAEEEVVE
ncbi:MAG: hypothetical protein J6T00_01825 [Bacteroidaceae bacterium]|nr:hypothetical protein [Bacteroidaceae bacterium]